MKSAYVSLLLSLVVLTASSQELQLSKLDSSNFFDFWEGTWEGTWDEGEGKVGRATNFIEWTTGDKVLQENFEIYEGQSKGFFGTSISVFNPRTKVWRQAWADSQGGYYDFIGDFDGDKRIFKTHPKEINGHVVIQRMVFYNLKSDSFMWNWEGSQDGGKTWKLNWQIKYVKK